MGEAPLRTSTVRELYALGQPWPYPGHPDRRAPVRGTWYYEGRAIRFVHDLAQAPRKRDRQPGLFGLDFGEMVRHPQGYLCDAPLIVIPGEASVQWAWLVPELIPVYGRFPADLALDVERFLAQAEYELAAVQGRDVTAQYQAWQAAFRHDYPADRYEWHDLPWTMADLCGSVWRNVHLGSVRTMRLGVDRFGHHVLQGHCPAADYEYEVGVWENGRYSIGHDVRVDHLPPAVQLQWFRVEYTRQRLALCQARRILAAAECGAAAMSRRGALSAIARAEADRADLEAQARAFAQDQGLLGSAAWAFFQAGLETRQLALF